MRRGEQLIRGFLREGYGVQLRVQGTSMLPTIRPGSMIVVHPVLPRLLQRGDIVLCDVAGRLLGHRIVGLWHDQAGGQKILLRGDNLRPCDRTVDATAVLGRITKVEETWRWALNYVGRWLVAESALSNADDQVTIATSSG